MATLGSSSQVVTEYVVRVPKNTPKRYNIMAFNSADRVTLSSWGQARMERDMSNKRIYAEEELPESGAGSEFHRKLREEARRKKYGIVLREFRAEDQPWILRVNGKTGRKFRGVKKGGVTENASYYVFTQCPDGAFEAFPVRNWYNFTPLARHRTLTAEEAEEEWERRNKVLNHFTIMQQRRLRDQDEEEEEKDKGRKAPGKGGGLRIHDLEEDLELSSESSEGSEAEGEKGPRPKGPPGARKRRRRKGRKGSEDEALEDSDDGDFEGQEVDYMSDGSSSSAEEDPGKAKAPKEEEEGPKGIDEASESSEESEEEKGEEKEEEEEGKATPTPQEKKKKRESSDESQTSEESDIDSETSSALFMAKKKTPPKRERRASGSSSRGGSRPGTPTDSGGTGGTLRAAAARLEQGRRAPPGGSEPPPQKRLKAEPGPPLRQEHPPAPLGEEHPQQRGGAADGGGRAPVPVPQAHDHQGPAEEVPDQAHGAQLRRHRQRAGPAAEAPRPREEAHRGQDALLPQGVGTPRAGGSPKTPQGPPKSHRDPRNPTGTLPEPTGTPHPGISLGRGGEELPPPNPTVCILGQKWHFWLFLGFFPPVLCQLCPRPPWGLECQGFLGGGGVDHSSQRPPSCH